MANSTVIKTVTPVAETGIGSWKYRRNYMYVITAFCIATVFGIILGDRSGDVAEIAVQSSFWLIFGITFLYVFGVSVQDLVALRTGYGMGSTIKINKTVLETDNTSTVDDRVSVDGQPLQSTTVQSSEVRPADGASS